MKGVSLISDVFLLISLLAITIISSLFIWALIVIFQVESRLSPMGVPTTRSVEMKLLFKPVNYDSLMSSFLEYESSGIKVRKILNAVAIQGKTDIWLDNEFIDARAVSSNFLDSQISNDYLLKLGDMVILKRGSFASGNLPLGIQKVSTNLFLLNGEKIYLQLFVVD